MGNTAFNTDTEANNAMINTAANTMKMIDTSTETRLIPNFINEYASRNAKAAARHALWTNFMLERSFPYILEESLNLFKSEGDKWLSLIFGEEGLDFRLEGYTPQPGEVIVVPKLHILTLGYRLGEDIYNIIRPHLKWVQFCTRKEADSIRADYRAREAYAASNENYFFLPSPPILVEVEDLQGGEDLLEIDAALR